MRLLSVFLMTIISVVVMTSSAHATWRLESRSINPQTSWNWNNPSFFDYEVGSINAIGGQASGKVFCRSQWPGEASVNLTGTGFQHDKWKHKPPDAVGEVELQKSVDASGEVEIRNGPSSAGAYGAAMARHKFNNDPWVELRHNLSVGRATSAVTWGNLGLQAGSSNGTHVTLNIPLSFTTGTGYSNQAPNEQQDVAMQCPVTIAQLRSEVTLDLRAWAQSDFMQLLTSVASCNGSGTANIQAFLLEHPSCPVAPPPQTH